MTISSTIEVDVLDLSFLFRKVVPPSTEIVNDLGFSKTSEPKRVELLFDK